ncbi:MAG: ATP-binding cassette domain-containing protein [Vicinamibacterales bacterium]
MSRYLSAPSTNEEVSVPPDLAADDFSLWLSAAADHEGLETERIYSPVAKIATRLAYDAPALLRLQFDGTVGFLAVIDGTKESLTIVTPDLRRVSISARAIDAVLHQQAIKSLKPEVARLVSCATLSAPVAERVQSALIDEEAMHVYAGDVWRLRAAAAQKLREAVAQTGLTRGIALLVVTHAMQAALFVGSWWLLGRGLLDGRLDRGWLLGWLLLILSLVPFRLATSWIQSLLAVTAGASLRRRLLRGVFRIDPQHLRAKGPGQFFGMISESAAVESLALSGSFVGVLSLVELGMAGVVLWASAGWLPVALLVGWTAAVGWLGRRYLQARERWTRDRLEITDRVIEHMVGHRTRLLQQAPAQRHTLDDDALERQFHAAVQMDRWELRLLTIAPRGWMAIALGVLAPLAVTSSSPGPVAAALGGMLIAYRAFRRLTGAVSDIGGAAIAGRLVAPLARAASDRDAPTLPAAAVPSSTPSQSEGIAALARDLVFRYREAGAPVLDDCSLRIPRGARLLLEGPSGSGKTTLASLIAGLSVPDSGLLLIDGLDRSVLGTAGWRARVAMAPQLHDNHLVSGSLALNLLMGRRWPARPEDLADAELVCRELGLGDLLNRMPAGIHQVVGETGWQLSQGERTRLFLARALLQRPELLVLDESFSALDPENVEKAVRCISARASSVLAIAHP